jgi:multiple sugar transport system ATP-binding protein
MRASLSQLHVRLGTTVVYVTHDQTEAMTLGQRVAVMRGGRIVQVDEPQRLYREPRDLFVAAFIGSPAMNLVEARIEGDEVSFGQFTVPLDPGRRPPAGVERVILGIRPEAFDAAEAVPARPRLEVDVEVLEDLGADANVFFRVDAPRIAVESHGVLEEEDTLLAEATSLFTARVDPATEAQVGAALPLAVDPTRFHFFDVADGASLLAPAPAREPEAVA